MTAITACQSLDNLCRHLDAIDRQIVTLLAERGAYIRQTGRFNTEPAALADRQRLAPAISRARALSLSVGADPDTTERVYLAMLEAFGAADTAEYPALATG